jgi:putative acetyltransferase
VTTGPGKPFTVPGPGPFPVSVRLESPADEPGVRRVNLAAFTGPEEAAIVDRIRSEAPDGWHSLVAVGARGSGADGIIVGHLLLSPCAVVDPRGAVLTTVLAIGPVAALPELQHRGIGSALMAAAIGLAIARAVPAIVLLGHPSYYPRFGFEPARGLGLLPPADAWPDPAWMARRLPAWTDSMRGTVRYPEAFEPLA